MMHIKSLPSMLWVSVTCLVTAVLLVLGLGAPTAQAMQPAASQTCNQQVLRVYDRGDCVQKLQKLLQRRGEWIGKHGADGVFGGDTRRGVIDYQKRYNLLVDGIVGPQTWGHLLSGKVRLGHLNDSCFITGKWICVDKSDNKTYVFENGKLIRQMASRTGGWHYFKGKWNPDHTPNGSYRISYRVRHETSNIYNDAKMPHSQYINRPGGYALHGSPTFAVDGQFSTPYGKGGSGGCVNLMPSDARWLWKFAGIGDHVLIQS